LCKSDGLRRKGGEGGGFLEMNERSWFAVMAFFSASCYTAVT
jgi:hypothetical protein